MLYAWSQLLFLVSASANVNSFDLYKYKTVKGKEFKSYQSCKKPIKKIVLLSIVVPAQKIHASSATYLALMKDNAYELQLRGEIEVKVRIHFAIYNVQE